MNIGDLRYADAAMHQRRGDEIWQREMRLDDLRRDFNSTRCCIVAPEGR
jgi:hypothetical protein